MSSPIPILRGDYPDPTIVRVGGDYYLTNSTNVYSPSLLIQHSRDLVNWRPSAVALPDYDGDIWAPDISYHLGRFYIYYTTGGKTKVVHAETVDGPWSTPVDVKVPPNKFEHVEGDPTHVVEGDQRYLFLSGGCYVKLAADGLSAAGEVQQIYSGWPIPSTWRIEGDVNEGPKLFKRGGYWYLVTAQGGTAGPSTSHMAVVARSESLFGPWQNAPNNPLLHTWNREERWYSAGHATVIEGADGEWWIVYHAYDKGYWTLGRHTLVEKIVWGDDGWPKLGETPALASSTPTLSDSFDGPELGWQWRFYRGLDRSRYSFADRGLRLESRGVKISESHPMVCLPEDHAYEVSVEVELLHSDTEAGILLWYNESVHTGIALSGRGALMLHNRNQHVCRNSNSLTANLKLVNDHHEIDFWVQLPGNGWVKLPYSYETSGWQHNTLGGFLGLRVGLAAAGGGGVIFRNFAYQQL